MHFVTNPRDVKSKTSSLQPSSISELGVLLNLHAAVLVDTGDGGKGMVRDTMVAKELAALDAQARTGPKGIGSAVRLF